MLTYIGTLSYVGTLHAYQNRYTRVLISILIAYGSGFSCLNVSYMLCWYLIVLCLSQSICKSARALYVSDCLLYMVLTIRLLPVLVVIIIWIDCWLSFCAAPVYKRGPVISTPVISKPVVSYPVASTPIVPVKSAKTVQLVAAPVESAKSEVCGSPQLKRENSTLHLPSLRRWAELLLLIYSVKKWWACLAGTLPGVAGRMPLQWSFYHSMMQSQ